MQRHATGAVPWERIRCAKDTGLRNLPLHGYAQNQIWCEIVALACELLAWMQMLAFTGPARRWEPRRLRLRMFSVAGRIVRGGRRLRLRLAASWPWAHQRDSQAVTLTGNGRAIPSHSLGSPSQEHERDRLAEAEGGNRSCKGLPTATENTFWIFLAQV